MKALLIIIWSFVIVLGAICVHIEAQAQDSTFFYGTLEDDNGVVILKTQDAKHRLLFQKQSDQADARARLGEIVKVLGRPGYIGKESPLIVVFVRPLEKK